MAYIDIDYLASVLTARRLADLSDDAGAGAMDTDVVGRAIDEACAQIDEAAAAAGYPTPLTGALVTKTVKINAAWMAAYILGARRSEFYDQNGRPPYWQPNDRAMAWRRDLAEKKLQLEAAAAGETSEAVAISSAPRRGWT